MMLVPVAVLATGACFATTNDMRVLQGDLQLIRAEMAAGDSATRAALDAAIVRVAILLTEVSDTVKATNATTMRLRGDVREDLQNIRQQLIAIQELTGQSQSRIERLRAEMEARANELAQPPAGTTPPRGAAPAGAAPAAGAASVTPGPSQLYQLGQDQARANRNSAARTVFMTLLAQYPSSDLAPDALYGVAEAWWADGNGQAADSVYSLVVERYPKSPRAPVAMYKRATLLRTAGQQGQARVIYRQIVDRYPQSEAALLAADFLRARP